LKNFLKSFIFDKNNKPQPIYFWASIFLLQITICNILKFIGINWMSDAFVLGMMGFVVAIVGLFNIFRKVDK